MAENLNNAQLMTLAIIPHVTGLISVLASSYVLQDIYRDPKKRRRTYCRLVFGMAAIDFITSLMYTFSTLPMEQGAAYGVFALGNHATCATQAFLIQMEIASPIYHFYLAWYYLLILKYRWPERKFQAYENYMHGFAIFFSLGTSIGLIPLDVYGEFFVWCWITNVEGNGYYQWFSLGPLWFIIILSSVIMAQMCLHVRAEETVSRKWRSSVVDARKLGEKKLKKMTGRVFWQAMHYELAFYVTWTIPTISQTILQLTGIQPAFGLQLATAIFTPLSGFFNFTIYIRPRYVKYMEENKKEMWWYVIWKTMKQAVPTKRMKVEIVEVDYGQNDSDFKLDDDDEDGNENGTKTDNKDNSARSDGEKEQRPPSEINVEETKVEDTDQLSDSMNVEDLGYEDPNKVITTSPNGQKKRNSHSILVLDYEEDDVGVMDPAAALEQLATVDRELQLLSLPKRGTRKVYKLVKRANHKIAKRRRSLMGSVRSLVGGVGEAGDVSESRNGEG